MEEPLLNWYIDNFNSVEFRQTYGLTELGILKIKNESPKSLYITIGGNSKYKVVDDALHIKSEYPMLGYLNQDSPFDEEGYYDTKDIVSEKNGYFKILGRETDLVNIGGIKINPHELESHLLTNENIKEALAYGVKNNILGQTINLDIQQKKNSITKEINKFILEKFQQSHNLINFVEDKQYNHRFKNLEIIQPANNRFPLFFQLTLLKLYNQIKFMKIKKDDLLEIVNKKIQNISDEFDIQLTQEKDTIYVYSEKGNFDSMMLVVLISEIEEELLLKHDIEISLTSDKAMSKNTPFETNLSILNLIIESDF